MNIVGNVDIGFLDFFDVHVLEGHDAHGLDETAGTVDIPYPCVSQLHIEIHVLTSGTHVEIDLIRQVEATLSLHHIGEQLDDVTVFPIQREFGVGFVIVEILGTHACLLTHFPYRVCGRGPAYATMLPLRACVLPDRTASCFPLRDCGACSSAYRRGARPVARLAVRPPASGPGTARHSSWRRLPHHAVPARVPACSAGWRWNARARTALP
ncbi:Hypothetical protein Blongum51A_0228 [Bifidobacterium longum]|nr:Hypothetical protein Blongum51A_0228 [Bifidobacterium longum]